MKLLDKIKDKAFLCLLYFGLLPAVFLCQRQPNFCGTVGQPHAFVPPVPCNTNPYVLVFDDEFSGNTLDLNKWITSKMDSNFGGAALTPLDYDNGVNNMVFNHPGLTIVDKAVPTFWGYATYKGGPTGDGKPNYRAWDYTSSSLNSRFQFGYGIYQLAATLPKTNWGSIYPSFWMVGGGVSTGPTYQELDVFEFPFDSKQDWQTYHWPYCDNSCGASCDPGNTDFAGTFHTFTLVYTPYELDWYVDNTITESQPHFIFANGTAGPVPDCTTLPGSRSMVTDDPVFPNNPNPLLSILVMDGIQPTAYKPIFTVNGPSNFNIQSIKYWKQAPESVSPCNSGASGDVTVVNDMIDNSGQTFNSFIGNRVFISCAEGSIPQITIPTYTKPNVGKDYFRGSLEAIAKSEIVVTGRFQCGGYMVLKTNSNLCNEYTGPTTWLTKKMNTGEDGTIATPNSPTLPPSQPIEMFVKSSATNGQFSIGLNGSDKTQLNKEAVMSVYNMMGQVVCQKSTVIREGLEETFDLSSQPKGIYLVELKTNDKSFTKKIVLQ